MEKGASLSDIKGGYAWKYKANTKYMKMPQPNTAGKRKNCRRHRLPRLLSSVPFDGGLHPVNYPDAMLPIIAAIIAGGARGQVGLPLVYTKREVFI